MSRGEASGPASRRMRIPTAAPDASPLRIRVEAIGWLSATFGGPSSGTLRLEETVRAGASVGQFVAFLARKYPKFGKTWFQEDGRLADLVTVVVNDRLVSLPGEQDTILHDGDTVVLVPAFAGG